MEAHGGYAFCAIAALEILGETHLLDMPKFIVSLFISQHDYHF